MGLHLPVGGFSMPGVIAAQGCNVFVGLRSLIDGAGLPPGIIRQQGPGSLHSV